jgi:hypothetical protein
MKLAGPHRQIGQECQGSTRCSSISGGRAGSSSAPTNAGASSAAWKADADDQCRQFRGLHRLPRSASRGIRELLIPS